MLREIKFRGYSKTQMLDSQWVYGSLVRNFFYESDTDKECVYIANPDFYPDYDSFDDFESLVVEVDPESVGQYTGLKDKHGKDIYEGDVYHQGDPNITYTVVWHDTGLIGKQNGSSSYAGLAHWKDRIVIIGNVFDEKHLLEDDRND